MSGKNKITTVDAAETPYNNRDVSYLKSNEALLENIHQERKNIKQDAAEIPYKNKDVSYLESPKAFLDNIIQEIKNTKQDAAETPYRNRMEAGQLFLDNFITAEEFLSIDSMPLENTTTTLSKNPIQFWNAERKNSPVSIASPSPINFGK